MIGENPVEQLDPFSEHIAVDKYKCKIVTQKEKKKFLSVYTKYDPKRSWAKISKDEAKKNKKLSFDKLYKKYGKDWNDNSWEKDENGKWAEYSTYNPNSKHDYFSLGGRWTGYFKLKDGATGKAGKPGLQTSPAKPGYADRAVKADIDFDSMIEDAGKEAEKKYNDAMKILGKYPKNKSWSDLIDFNDKKMKRMGRKKKDEFIKTLREKYWSQPRLKAWKKEQNKKNSKWTWASADEFVISKEEYIQNAKNQSISPFAVLKDGKWFEKGDMGWWGIVSNEKQQNSWHYEVATMLVSLPDDTLLSAYDCHI